MDTRKLSYFILALGAFMIIVGIGTYAFNQHLDVQSEWSKVYKERGSKLNIFDQLNFPATIGKQNIQRSQKRESAKSIIIWGGIVLFIGTGVYVSAKKASPPSTESR